MVDPGTGIAIAQIAFFAACKAVDAFGTALHYFDDAEALTIALEIERLRLQTWGANSGLADGTLAPHLAVASEILLRELDVIARIFEDADKVRDRYGVQAPAEGEPSTRVVSGLITRMRKSLRSSGVKLYGASSSDKDGDDVPATTKASTVSRSMSNRVRWVIKDRDQLKKLVTDLRDAIDLLNKLLTETQRRRFINDYERINVLVVGSAVDDKSLAMIRAAVDIERDPDTLAKVDRKSLSTNETRQSSGPISPVAMKSLRLAQYDLPPDFATCNRFLAPKKDSLTELYLFERKAFEPDLDHNSKTLLWNRVQKLISLLALPKSTSFKVPQAAGYIHDPEHYCWWLVFHFQPASGSTLETSSQPSSLLRLLQPDYKPRPPLEQRFRIASDISSTLYELYSSNWMHKSIRSDNILFSCVEIDSHPPANQLGLPVVCGFEYSRLETEAQTIDRSKANSNVNVAMYRHPDYQGEAAQGYKIQYDIYSLGLVLLEIGIWAPLTSLFDSKRSKAPASGSAPPALPSGTKHFHSPEAKLLRDRVTTTIRKDLPFRMGSAYAGATQWCIDYGDKELPVNVGEPPNHALEFYNHVVEPLCNLNVTYAGTNE
ncbi:hypothetical protein FALBO_1054 [Fusarium albosuccineum]|uniref:Protein kinase domain-containing protein n=1 Tax=Fusarium albosuccineum TaxID=1237068 RepID=A0A8H4LPP6_9HYPO|nr:hypothetical protein FALBO_1054 [Fusarium albosuccineum]